MKRPIQVRRAVDKEEFAATRDSFGALSSGLVSGKKGLSETRPEAEKNVPLQKAERDGPVFVLSVPLEDAAVDEEPTDGKRRSYVLSAFLFDDHKLSFWVDILNVQS